MTQRDELLRSLIRATRPDMPEDEIAAIEHGMSPDPNADALNTISNALGGPIALNDDAALARAIGAPLSHGTHFTR